MSSVTRWGFRGRQQVSGWLIRCDLRGETASREFVLANWQAGSRLWETTAGWWLELAKPVFASSPWPAAPVLARDGAHVAVPVSEPVWRALEPSTGALVVAVEGAVVVVVRTAMRRLDPSAWVDVSSLAMHVVTGPPEPPVLQVEASPCLQSAAEDELAWLTSAPDVPVTRPSPLAERSGGWWRRLRGRVFKIPEPAREVLSEHEQDVEARIREVQRRFAQGAWEDALPLALALRRGNTGNGASRRPRRRRPHRVSRAVGGELKQHYERAVDRLTDGGRMAEAAFVLAELLDDVRRAVSLLEAHDRYEEAAALAIEHGLEPAWVVQLWWRAGETERALSYARSTGALEAAVALEESTRGEVAWSLRWAWARLEASGGRLGVALSVMTDIGRARPTLPPDPAQRAAVQAWALRWSQRRDVVTRQVLPTLVQLSREEDAVQLGRRVLADTTAWGPARRQELAEALLDGCGGAALTGLASPLLRGMLEDVAEGHGAWDDAHWCALAQLAGDPLLQVDVPRAPARDAGSGPASRAWSASDIGRHAVLDVAVAADGHVWCALGLAGLVVLDAEGQTRLRSATPCDALVADPHGDIALGIRRHGSRLDVTRHTLSSGNSVSWTSVVADVWAPSVSGSTWCVASGGTVVQLDVLSPMGVMLRHLGDVSGLVEALFVDEDGLVVVRRAAGARSWSRLSPRQTPRWTRVAADRVAWGHGGPVTALQQHGVVSLTHPGWTRPVSLLGTSGTLAGLTSSDDMVVSLVMRQADALVDVFHAEDGTHRGRLVLEDAGQATLCRAAHDVVAVADARGRVVALRQGAIYLDRRV